MDTVESYEYKGFNIEINLDVFPEDSNPREWDNLGTMVCGHSRYSLGDEQFSSQNELREFEQRAEDEEYVMLPLYLYDHSGITMNTTGFSCPWDSGQVGWVYVTREDIEQEYGTVNDETIAKALSVMNGEVETYDQYLRGEVYRWDVHDSDMELVDSCGGYLGDMDYAKSDAEATVDNIISKENA